LRDEHDGAPSNGSQARQTHIGRDGSNPEFTAQQILRGVQQAGQATIDSIATALALLEVKRAELEVVREAVVRIEAELEIKKDKLRAVQGQMRPLDRRHARAEAQLARGITPPE
jgi:uncharacterized membrane protein